MLKILRNKLDIILAGEIKIDKSKLKSYELYMLEEIEKQKREETIKFLDNKFPSPFKTAPEFYSEASYYLDVGYKNAINKIADYLVKQEYEDDH